MPPPVQSLNFFSGRAYSLCYARFRVTTDFQASLTVDMIPQYTDLVDSEGRNQSVIIKDIVASAFLPYCRDQESELINPTDDVRALFHGYTFLPAINNTVIQFPVDFVTNADRYRTSLVLSRYDDVVRSLTAKVRRDIITPVLQGADINVTLTLAIEMYLFNKDAV